MLTVNRRTRTWPAIHGSVTWISNPLSKSSAFHARLIRSIIPGRMFGRNPLILQRMDEKDGRKNRKKIVKSIFTEAEQH